MEELDKDLDRRELAAQILVLRDRYSLLARQLDDMEDDYVAAYGWDDFASLVDRTNSS